MLKTLKQATLKSLKTSGVFRLVQNSSWRRERLLILAYHGISLADEHEWDGSLYLSPERFESRLRLLKSSGANVLPLDEAIRRLYSNDLPERSVALTFDDGNHDFLREAYPLLKDFAFPVTLYLTTFYARYNRPVFDVICSYLLWRGRGRTLSMRELTGRESSFDLSTAGARRAAWDELQAHTKANNSTAEEKDSLAAALSRQLGVDYDELLARRLLHLLNAEEVKQLADAGVDIQLHTHRHRTPLDRQLFRREIEDNRESIRAMTGKLAHHFCYPSGRYDLAFLPWLEELGVLSATTCETGFATRESQRLLLPRLLDNSSLSAVEFEGWLTGIAAALPRRAEA